MQETTNYNLKKPELTDAPPDITETNPNWDTVDTQLKTAADHRSDSDIHFTAAERLKLLDIDEEANNYTHPVTHPPSIITQDASNRFMTDAERIKLGAIESMANAYIHPPTHPATIVVQDAINRFVTDTEKATWNGKADGSHAHGAGDITSGTFGVERGGTGRSTLTSGYFLQGNGTSLVNLLTGAGLRNVLGLGNTTGALPAANGGTGVTSLAALLAALDIEFGAWTPTISTTYVLSTSYDIKEGFYIKLGDYVIAGFSLKFTSRSGLSAVQVEIGGLPYAAAQNGGGAGMFTPYATGYYGNGFFVASGGSTFGPRCTASTGGASLANWQSSANYQMYGILAYKTS